MFPTWYQNMLMSCTKEFTKSSTESTGYHFLDLLQNSQNLAKTKSKWITKESWACVKMKCLFSIYNVKYFTREHLLPCHAYIVCYCLVILSYFLNSSHNFCNIGEYWNSELMAALAHLKVLFKKFKYLLSSCNRSTTC